MATIILAGLIYITCECYLDDVLIPATYEDCITNLRQVFDRFRKYKIYLNPDKCELCAPSIEFLGHTFKMLLYRLCINKDGASPQGHTLLHAYRS